MKAAVSKGKFLWHRKETCKQTAVKKQKAQREYLKWLKGMIKSKLH